MKKFAGALFAAAALCVPMVDVDVSKKSSIVNQSAGRTVDAIARGSATVGDPGSSSSSTTGRAPAARSAAPQAGAGRRLHAAGSGRRSSRARC